jgi:hypothetical protein
VQSRHHHHFIDCILFSPWYKQQSFTYSLKSYMQEKQQIPILLSLVWSDRWSDTRPTTLEASTLVNHYTTDAVRTCFEKYCCSCTETSFDSLLRVSYIVLIKPVISKSGLVVAWILSIVFALIRNGNSEYLLKEALAKVSNKYDYIIIDCPPSLNMLTINAYTLPDSSKCST